MKKTGKPEDKKVRRVVVLRERTLEQVTGGTESSTGPKLPLPMRDWGW